MEVAVIGGGIVGCAAAALLAETGARVTLYERERIAAGASGRNQGVLQHPLDPVLTPLYEESLRMHAETAPELELDRTADGLLLVCDEASGPAQLAPSVAESYPELSPTFLDDAFEAEPALAPGLSAWRLDTGHQVPPAAVTQAWAARAAAAGARIELGRPVLAGDVAADAVLVAAGPWTPGPVTPVWGVTAQVRLERPPRHALEEAVLEEVAAMTGELPPAFAAVTAGGLTTIGATFLLAEPDHRAVAPSLLERARTFLPQVSGAELVATRACARPVSADGRPLIGRLPDPENAWLATGNGPWGMTCGPATARIAVDALLGRSAVPAALDAAR